MAKYVCTYCEGKRCEMEQTGQNAVGEEPSGLCPYSPSTDPDEARWALWNEVA